MSKVLDNELGLIKVFSILYNGMYPEAEDSFYVKMLPAYEFCKTHMEMLEVMWQERHPDYEQLHATISISENSEYHTWRRANGLASVLIVRSE